MGTETLNEVFEQLDRVMKEMEQEDITLEDSFRLYQDGLTLLKTCSEKIDTVEKQMKILDEEGTEHEF